MDGNLSPIHRVKNIKCIYCDLFSSAIAILSIETALLSSWLVYYSISLWSYYANGRQTTQDVIDAENGEHVLKPLIPNDLIYYLILIGVVLSMILQLFIFLGTCWLFIDFLQIWKIGSIVSNVYFTFVFFSGWLFSRQKFPWELLYILIRCYFIYIILSFIKQIKNDTVHDYDYKAYAEEYSQKTGTKFVSIGKDHSPKCQWCCFMYWFGKDRRNNIVAPLHYFSQKDVIRNMRRDLDLVEPKSDVEVIVDSRVSRITTGASQ